MDTPLNLLISALQIGIDQQIAYLGKKWGSDLQIMGIGSNFNEGMYVEARFNNAANRLPDFFEQINTLVGKNEHVDGLPGILDYWLYKQGNLPQHRPTPEVSYILAGVPGINDLVYSASTNEMLPWLNQLEERGGVSYRLWTPIFSYCLEGNTKTISELAAGKTKRGIRRVIEQEPQKVELKQAYQIIGSLIAVEKELIEFHSRVNAEIFDEIISYEANWRGDMF